MLDNILKTNIDMDKMEIDEDVIDDSLAPKVSEESIEIVSTLRIDKVY